MDKSIYRYILRHSAVPQAVLTSLAIVSFPFLYVFYELPKEIVNGAIQASGRSFPVHVLNFELGQVDYLFLLSGIFLVLVGVNQGFKYAINVYRGITGERLLRRLRYDLFSRVIRFPLPHFRKASQGELISMITGEVEPLGGFFGDAISVPVFQGGTLLVILGFLFVQDWAMALAAVSLYPVQAYLIPRLQRKVNDFAKRRVRLMRHLSQRIGETVSGVAEIRAHDGAALELANFSSHLGQIYNIRLQIYIWKFIIKFINNSINHLGPFCFYAIGGYLVIQGRLEIGTLLAAIAAFKDLAAPWKELLAYYQQREDARIKYEQVIEQFQPPGMIERAKQLDEPEEIVPLSGDIVGTGVRLEDDGGTVLLSGASFRIPTDAHVAVVGDGASGKDDLARVIAGLIPPSAGSVTIGGLRLSDLPEAVTGRRIGYVPSGVYLFSTSVRDNLYFGLKHRPLVPAIYDAAEAAVHDRDAAEARSAGNSSDDPNADWIDYAAAGVPDGAALSARTVEVLEMVELAGDIYDMGLRGSIEATDDPELASRLLEARREFRSRLARSGFARAVEAFDVDRYNDNATIAENLLFGSPVGGAFRPDRLAESPYVLRILEDAGLAGTMLDMGREIASTMVELFADLSPGHEFFEQYSFITSDELPKFQTILARIGREGIESLREDERRELLSLPFRMSPARHRLGVIDDDLRRRILRARRLFAELLPPDLAGSVEFFDLERYNSAASVQDNILFGKIAYGEAQAASRVGALIGEVVDSLGLRQAVIEIGLDYQVGIGGARLSAGQRQKIAIARAVLKRPDLLILNEATAGLDRGTQARMIVCLREEMMGRGLVWVLDRAEQAADFDRILVMRNGTVVEEGAYAELDRDGSTMKELIGAA